MSLSSALLIDPESEAFKICTHMRRMLTHKLNRRGLVVAISGGVDSAVCAALAARTVGPERVFGLLMPERDSSVESTRRGRMVIERFGIASELFDISETLDALGCYRWRDEAIRSVFPDYGPDWQSKIAIQGGHAGLFNYFRLVVRKPTGEILDAKLDYRNYLQIVASTNFKQRIRKTFEYFHADRLHYAVVGTPNRVEYDQGFFVKNGDGSADLKPIAHLYKTQVFQLARHLGVPEDICNAQPTTDTYSMQQGQDEFYFALPYQQMDLALYALNHGVPAAILAGELGIGVDLAEQVYRDIETKRRTTAMLHWPGLLVAPVSEPDTGHPMAAEEQEQGALQVGLNCQYGMPCYSRRNPDRRSLA